MDHNLTATPARRKAGVLTHPLPRMDRERGRSSDAQLSFPAADLNFKALRVRTCPTARSVTGFLFSNAEHHVPLQKVGHEALHGLHVWIEYIYIHIKK